MVVPGRVENGVVVFEGGPMLPEGADVSIFYPAALTDGPSNSRDHGQSAVVRELERLRNLPNENPGDPFDAADHDRELYGSAG
jgi:hypothetical protein